jgi:predicted kinase
MSTLIILCGEPYAGKTTLAQALVRRFRYESVDVDVTKERLYGLGLEDEDLTHDQWVRIYEQTDQQIADYLQAGHHVLDDSRNFRKFERVHAKGIAEGCQANFVTIYVKTPEAILRQRLHENREHPTRHDLADPDFERFLLLFEPPTEDEQPLVFHCGESLNEWVDRHPAELS